MTALLQLFRTRPSRWANCTPLSPAERMARYSQRHADDMRVRDNLSNGFPRTRHVNGRTVLLALPGRVNKVG